MHSGKSFDADIAYLSFNDLVLLLFMFLVTLRMLTDRAGCYNVHEKKLIVLKLTSTVNSSGIATFSVRGEGLRSVSYTHLTLPTKRIV